MRVGEFESWRFVNLKILESLGSAGLLTLGDSDRVSVADTIPT